MDEWQDLLVQYVRKYHPEPFDTLHICPTSLEENSVTIVSYYNGKIREIKGLPRTIEFGTEKMIFIPGEDYYLRSAKVQ